MKPLPDITLEAPAQHTAHADRYRRGQAVPVWLALQNCGRRLGHGCSAERLMSREHFVQHAREGPDIAAGIDTLTADLLRAHVPRRSGHQTFPAARSGNRQGHGHLALVRQRGLREAEVEHLHRACGGELDVRRLEVAVDDPLLVRGLQRLGDLAREFECHVERQRSAGKTIGQGRAVDHFHHNGVPAACDFEAVDGGDVRMVQRREQPRLALQPRDPIRIVRQRRRQNLDGDFTMQPRVERTIDLAHATGVQRSEDAICSELESGRHRRCSASRCRGVESCQPFDRRLLGKRSGGSVRRKQRQHFIGERDVVAALVAHERRTPIGRTRQRLVEDLLDARPPAADVAHDCAVRPTVRRRYSQARADCHSRVIVVRDNDRMAATSSSDSPPKYFISTI